MMRFLKVAVALWLAPVLFAQHPIMQIKVAGAQRLPTAAVIAASGLRVGQTVNHAQLDAAAQKLADTGFFASVSYAYDPKTVGGVTGYALTLQVSETASRSTLELDISGVDAELLWQQLKSADGLLDPQMPNNERASAYYKRAIEAALRKLNHPEEIVMKTEADLHTGRMVVVCRPAAAMARIAAIRFEGNAAVADATLQAAMAKVAIGQEYSERDFRRLLDYNVRPIYDELGRLTLAFPRVYTAGAGEGKVTAMVGIDEGPVWLLGKVVLTGDNLPLADLHEAARFAHRAPANWRQFMNTMRDMEQVLRRDGFITVGSKPVRTFQAATRTVDVQVEITKGPQFQFGELHIEGLDPGTVQRLAGQWKLAGGAPMNQPYIDEFVHAALPILRGKVRTSTSEMHIRPGTHVVDVTLKFH